MVENFVSYGYNFLLLYGGVGFGKIYLMYVVGNELMWCNFNVKVVYLYSECFVVDMILVLWNKIINEFKCFYCLVDVLLIDDI